MRVTSSFFSLALRGYSVASLPRRFALRARILGRFAPSKFKKKSVSQSTQNGLKRIKMQKKFFIPFCSERRSATLPSPAVASLPRASRFALAFSVASLHWALRFALATYPMSSQGPKVSLPSFMPIGPKLWALEGYIHRYIHT